MPALILFLVILALIIGGGVQSVYEYFHKGDDVAYCRENPYAPSCGNDPNPDLQDADPCNHIFERNCDLNTDSGDMVPDENGDAVDDPWQ
jgi:hypothetical protein